LYKRDPDRYARVSAGDLSYQFYVKQRQQCKPFKYFLDVVAPDMKLRYPLDEPAEFASGAVSTRLFTNEKSYTALHPHTDPIDGR
jgi:polypeptide N-acetylgalactosaminyltransferase